jgi:hypothetical protein
LGSFDDRGVMKARVKFGVFNVFPCVPKKPVRRKK